MLNDLLDTFDIDLSQSQRLLTLDIAGTALVPHRLVGEERVSAPFTYTLDCISQQGDIELKTLMAQPARLSILQADGSYRPLHGLVSEAALLGEDGGVTYYQLTLVPWLAMLGLGRDSRIFQDRSVIDVLTAVFDDYDLAKGRYRFDLRRDYPARSYCVQYREGDLNFISRILEEEGLWFYFEHSGPSTSADSGQDNASAEASGSDFDGHRLVITDDVDTTQPVSPQAIRFHRQAATEREDALTQWGGVRTQQPTRVSVGTFDYKQPSLTKRTGLDTLSDQGNLPPTELYDYAGEYYYHGYERGERLTENRLEAHESRAKRFRGSGGARQLQAGRWFELTQHPLHDSGGEAERQFLLLGVTVHAENALPVSAQLQALPGSLQPQLDAAKQAHGLEDEGDSDRLSDYMSGGTGHFLVDLEAQRLSQPYRHPLTHRRPVIGGPQTATVVGPANEEIHTDHLNRVRVQFHWDRQGQQDENSSVWLRVSQPNAGAGWGGVFVPRIGQEVLVDFLEGDADRPLITGRVYNGEQTPDWHSHGLLSGFKSKTYRGSKYNELVFDDATDQERVRLNSEADKSQLNLGYLIHQTGNTRGAFRGTGFELRTDAYGAIRANQGLYLTSWGQLGASGDQLDLTPARQQLDSAYQLSDSLSQSAADHNAEALDSRIHLKQAGEDADDRYGNSEQITDTKQDDARGATDSGGRGEAARMKAPWLHMASPAGITLSTPESTHLAQGRSLSVSSGEDVNVATGKSLVASISEKLSLFVYRAGMKLFAARGKVEMQAQDGEMAFTAEKGVQVTSTEGRIEVQAENGILLQSGGGYIRIEGGNIEVHCPGAADFKGAQHNFGGPTQMTMTAPQMASSKNVATFSEQVRGTDPKPIDQVLAQIAGAVYQNDTTGGWKPLSDDELLQDGIEPELLSNESTGFQAAIYSDGSNARVLAFAGTEFKDWHGDWWQGNIPQTLGFESAQYSQAMTLATQAHEAYGQNLAITGHSLGGGLASVAAVGTGAPAVTFNSAGIHDETLGRLWPNLNQQNIKRNALDGMIRRYDISGEILTWEQEEALPDKWILPDALGKRITLPDPSPLGSLKSLNPYLKLKDRVNDHFMDTMLEAFSKTPPWKH